MTLIDPFHDYMVEGGHYMVNIHVIPLYAQHIPSIMENLMIRIKVASSKKVIRHLMLKIDHELRKLNINEKASAV